MITVYIFISETCGVCKRAIDPILPELYAELIPRGIKVVRVEFSNRPLTYFPREPLRKLQIPFVYKGLCGTPMIVIHKEGLSPRTIFGGLANPEDTRYQIVFQISLLMLEEFIDNEESRIFFLINMMMLAENQNLPIYYLIDLIRDEMKKRKLDEIMEERLP